MSARLQHLRTILETSKLEGFLISSSSNIFYLSGFDRFLVDHDGFLFITKKRAIIITSPLYTGAVKKFIPDLEILETSPDLWYAQMIKKVVSEEKLKTVGFEERDLRVAEYFDLQEEKILLKSVSLKTLREQKENNEILEIEKACRATDKVFESILPFIRKGVSEIELSQKMDVLIKKFGGEIGFPSIIAFGRHSAIPHHMTSDEKLQDNSFVLFDFGLKCNKYLSDMSRTVFFGTPTNQQAKLYETVKKSQQEAIDYIQKHVGGDIFVKDVDKISRSVIEKESLPVYPHALGHGVGLEVHESPTLSVYSPEKLLENMVFTLEPGSYDPVMGGIRIEDVFVLQKGEFKQLTQSSKDLIVLS